MVQRIGRPTSTHQAGTGGATPAPPKAASPANVAARGWQPKVSGGAAPLATGFEARPADGKAFCTAALADIRARCSRGEKVRVVFDIDDTLADTRARTLAIGLAFDQANGTRHFARAGAEQMGGDGAETCQKLGLDEATSAEFTRVWDQEFWDGENFAHDTPMEETIRLARQAKEAGAEVIYLTGRIDALRGATLSQLCRFKLPDADGAHLFCKPGLATRTAPFKAEQLARWVAEGAHIGWFFTEGRRDTAHIQEALPKVPCVLLESSHGGANPVRADTPVFRRIS